MAESFPVRTLLPAGGACHRCVPQMHVARSRARGISVAVRRGASRYAFFDVHQEPTAAEMVTMRRLAAEAFAAWSGAAEPVLAEPRPPLPAAAGGGDRDRDQGDKRERQGAVSASESGPKRPRVDAGEEPGPLPATAVERLQANVGTLRSGATCDICLDLKNSPHGLQCGHSFCAKCIHGWVDAKPLEPTCPTCRAAVHAAPAPQREFQTLIRVMLEASVAAVFLRCIIPSGWPVLSGSALGVRRGTCRQRRLRSDGRRRRNGKRG